MQSKPTVKVTKAEYLARRLNPERICRPRTAEDGEAMQRLYRQKLIEECSAIEIVGDATVKISDFRVYVDRYVRSTGAIDSDVSVENSIFARVCPGTHVAIFRDRDVNRPNRRESNLVTSDIPAHHKIVMRASLKDQSLLLTVIGFQPMPPDPKI